MCWQGYALSEGSRGGSFLASSWLLMFPSNPWLINASLQSLPPSSHGFLSVGIPVSVSKFPVILDLGPTLIQYDLILTRLHLQKRYFWASLVAQWLRILLPM